MTMIRARAALVTESALVIDDPGLAQPIRANLFRDDDAGNAWSLHWSRQRDRGEKD